MTNQTITGIIFLAALLYTIFAKWYESKRIRTKNTWRDHIALLHDWQRLEIAKDEKTGHGISFCMAAVAGIGVSLLHHETWYLFLHGIALFGFVYMTSDILLNKLMGWPAFYLSKKWIFDKYINFKVRLIGLLILLILVLWI